VAWLACVSPWPGDQSSPAWVSDKTIQRILRHSNVAVTQNCYIKTVDSEVAAAMQQFERSLEYAPNVHFSGIERKHLM
jgi:hypothetical protein